MSDEKYLYVVISTTPTKLGKVIRKFGKTTYNHSAISLDDELKEFYAFARKQHNAFWLGKLVKENVRRYTLGKESNVPVAIFKLPISSERFQWIQDEIKHILEDGHYCYNLFSIMSYPFTGGLSIERSFTCVEFVGYILENVGYATQKPRWKIKPDDLRKELDPYLYYEGNLLDYVHDDKGDGGYFAPLNIEVFRESALQVMRLSKRVIKKQVTK